MPRLSSAARVGLILVTTLLALWLVLIALAYRAADVGRRLALPEVERVEAMAELAENLPIAQRETVLAAVRSAAMAAWIEPGNGRPPAGSRPAAGEVLAFYRSGLGHRALAVITPPIEERRRRFPESRIASPLYALEIRVGLATGETLCLATESPFVVARSGLPVGLFAGLVGTLIALAALVVLTREIGWLARLAAAVDRVDPAGQPVAIPPIRARAPEIRSLATAFDRLQTRLAAMIRARMALIGGIQHDLRTFATRLRLRIDHIPDDDERERAAADIADMMTLLDDAVLASRAGARELDRELIDLGALLHREVNDRRYAGARIDLTLIGGGVPAAVLGDRLALRRVFANLVDNALKYGEAAHLSLRIRGGGGGDATPDAESDETAEILVDDEGPGIPADQRATLMEPFVRLERSRARRTGGAGLGLAVVRNLVEAHGGTLTIGDAPTGGARLTVRLPLFLPA